MSNRSPLNEISLDPTENGIMKKKAYVVTREISTQRLRMLDDLQLTWERLFGENARRGHYARHQWIADDVRATPKQQKFNGVVDGRPVTVHLHEIAARHWYARELYLRALGRTRARYPDFDAHHFVDGDRTGERRIVFASERHALSGGHFWTSLWLITRDENPLVSEACLIEPCGSSGWPTRAPLQSGEVLSPDHVCVTVIVEEGDAARDLVAGVVADLKAGRTPTFDHRPIDLSFDDVAGGFTQITDPELVVLNWEDAVPALSPADDDLWKAAIALDTVGVAQALAAGADVNQMRPHEDSVLASVIEHWGWYQSDISNVDLARNALTRPTHRVSEGEFIGLLRRLLDAGAHPDLFQPDQVPAIVNASLGQQPSTTALLLEYGADPSIVAYWDEGPSSWPSAWDYAHTDGFHIDYDEGAREVFYEMIKRRSSPLYTQQAEDDDRKDAWLTPAEREWQPPRNS